MTSVDFADLSTVEAKRYDLKVIARSTNPPIDESYDIHIHVNDICEDATLDALETDVQIDYSYGDNLNISPAFTISEPTCTVEYTCTMAGGEPQSLCDTAYNTLSNTHFYFNPSTGQFSIRTSAYTIYTQATYGVLLTA